VAVLLAEESVDVCEDFIRSIHTLNYLIALLARFKSDFVLVPLADLVSGGVSMERANKKIQIRGQKDWNI
jgi:hypothetical protein